jgi:hypothetical protein
VAAVLLGIAVLVAIGATALAWRQVRRASAGLGKEQIALTLALKRVPFAERLGELARRAEPSSWEHQLAVEALAAPDRSAQVAAVNLALSELEHALTEGAAWPRAGVRIALLGTGLLASAAYIVAGAQIHWWLSILALGCVAALACFEADRSSRRNAAQRRRAVDELVAATFGAGAHPADDAGANAPRRGGAQRRHRRR